MRIRGGARIIRTLGGSSLASKSHLRVGVVGAGFMGKMHLKGLSEIIRRKLLPVSIEAIAGLNHTAGRKLAEKLGCRYFEGGGRLINDDRVDAVVIASPTDTHLKFARQVVAAGKPLFLEKPLGRNLAEAEKTAALLRKSRALHQIGLVLRFAPTYNVLKSLLDDKSNGEFICCRFRDDQFFPVRSIYDSDWRQRVNKSGGGALIEHSIHDVDVIQWFFGAAKVENSIVTPSHARGIEKLASLNLTFKGGGAAQLSTIWHHNFGRENERHIEIFFENRFFHTMGEFTSPIVIQGPKNKPAVILGKDEIERRYRAMIGWKDRKNADFTSTVGHEMYVFLKAVLEGRKKSPLPVDPGVEAHRVIEAAYRMGRKR